MPISFTCDFCSRKYRVADDLAGRSVKCKECGTDLTIPSGSPVASVARPKAQPHQDLYGLDDEAPPPVPRRAGFQPSNSSAPSGGGRRQAASGSDPILRILMILIVVGAAAVVLFFVGQAFLNSGLANNLVNGFAAAPGPPPDQPGPNVGGPFAGAAKPAEPPASHIHVTLSNGRSSPGSGRLRMPVGVTFQADYSITGQRPAGLIKYVTVIRGPSVRATDLFSNLHDSGAIGGSVMTFHQSDGPFEMYIQGEFAGPNGFRAERVSEIIPLPWHEPPPEQPQQPDFGLPRHGPPGGDIPGMPNFPRGGLPRGPGMGPFGPRGRGM